MFNADDHQEKKHTALLQLVTMTQARQVTSAFVHTQTKTNPPGALKLHFFSYKHDKLDITPGGPLNLKMISSVNKNPRERGSFC